MTTEGDLELAAVEIVSDKLSDALRSIADDQWGLATPCVEWDLSALVDHVTGGNWFTSRIFGGLSSDEAMTHTVKQFRGGSVTSEQATSSVTDQLAVFGRPGVLDRTWSHVVGDLTGRQILRLRLHDLIIHTWDIEQTLDPPAALPEHLLRWGLEELANNGSLTAKHFELGSVPMSETVENAATAYLRKFGR